MHFDFATVVIAMLLIASIVLALQPSNRLFAIAAVVASGLEALMRFHIINLSSGKIRIDLVLAAILVVAGGVCWARSATKSTVTAATVVVLLGGHQLLSRW